MKKNNIYKYISQEDKIMLKKENYITKYNFENLDNKKAEKSNINIKDYNKTKLLLTFDVRGKKVLDFGCSEGIYSFYLAEKGADVIGIDIDPERIRRANIMKKALGYDNVTFKCGSIFDSNIQKELPHFDLVLAWGFLHRIPDPYNALLLLSSKCNAISLEWRSPAFFFTKSFSCALHIPSGEFEWKNLNTNKKREQEEELAEFWRLSPGFVEAILNRQGFDEYSYKKIRNEITLAKIFKSSINLLTSLMRINKKPITWLPSNRIHLLANRKNGGLNIKNERDIKLEFQDWDGRFNI